jgi:hypothetical protein
VEESRERAPLQVSVKVREQIVKLPVEDPSEISFIVGQVGQHVPLFSTHSLAPQFTVQAMRIRKEMNPDEILPEAASAVVLRTGERIALGAYAHDCLKNGDQLEVSFEGAASDQSGADPRQILLHTITEFKQAHPLGSFELFLQTMWPDDYRVFMRGKAGHGSTKRSYSTWVQMFDAFELEAREVNTEELANQIESSLQTQAAEYAAAVKALEAAKAEGNRIDQEGRADPAGESEPVPEPDSDTLLDQIGQLSSQISLLKSQIKKQTGGDQVPSAI